MTEPTLKIGTTGYKLNPKKLAKAPQYITPYLFLGAFYYTEDYEYFDVIQDYLDIPEEPKTLEEISQELDGKFEKLIEQTKRNSYASKLTAERNYENKFNRIFDKFAYAKEHGRFPQPIKWVIGTGTGIDALDGSYLISGGSGGNVVSWSTEFNLKSNSVGYYSIDRDIKFNMTKKPNFVVRFCMDKLLGFKWESK
jgi:hypothetical protein